MNISTNLLIAAAVELIFDGIIRIIFCPFIQGYKICFYSIQYCKSLDR